MADQNETVKRTRDEYEFQPGYLEIIERPASPLARMTAFALVLLIIIALAWSFIGHLDIHASTVGRLIVSSHSKVIQSVEAGEVSSINVRDGQRVKKNELLLTLNPVGVEAQIRELEKQQIYKQLELARLKALLTEDPPEQFKPVPRASTLENDIARKHLLSEWQSITQQLDSFDSQMKVNLANQRAIDAELQGLKMLAGNVNQRLAATRKLVEKKQFPRIDFLEQETEALQLQLTTARKLEDRKVLTAESQSLQEQRDAYLAEQRLKYYDELIQAQESLAIISQRLVQEQETRRLHNIRSPVAGVVQQLAVHTRGGAVESAQQLMVIVPDEAQLEAEVMVLNKDVGFVNKGQPVEIKVDSFPYTRFGTIPGEVSHVSRDAVEHEQMGLVFPARVTLSESAIQVEGERVALQAGMSVNVEIRTGDRRVIDYLLSPLQEYQSEALRER